MTFQDYHVTLTVQTLSSLHKKLYNLKSYKNLAMKLFVNCVTQTYLYLHFEVYSSFILLSFVH